MAHEAPYGRQWLMGAGMLSLLAALLSVDLCFILLFFGRQNAWLLFWLLLAAALFCLLGYLLLRAGAPRPHSHSQDSSLTSSTQSQ